MIVIAIHPEACKVQILTLKYIVYIPQSHVGEPHLTQDSVENYFFGPGNNLVLLNELYLYMTYMILCTTTANFDGE